MRAQVLFYQKKYMYIQQGEIFPLSQFQQAVSKVVSWYLNDK